MIYRDLDINQPFFSSVDEISSTISSPDRINTYRNAAGDTVKRPGFFTYVDLGIAAPVDGLFNWENKLHIVTDGSLYKKVVGDPLEHMGSDLFVKFSRPTWAEFGSSLFSANGIKIIQITDSSATILTDPLIPAFVTHVVAFDNYLLANEAGTNRMYFSAVGEPTIWTGEFVSAEQEPDNIVAIHAQHNHIWMFGNRTVELWYNDGASPFVPMNGAAMSIGCKAPYSIKRIREYFYWINDIGQVVRSNGSGYEVLSDPVSNYFNDNYKYNNTLGDYIEYNDKHFYLLTNPDYGENGVTLVYDIMRNEWQGRWGSWDGKYNRFRAQSFSNTIDKPVIGDRTNGKIYYFGNVYEDDEELIRSSWRTGWFDHGTLGYKRSMQLNFKVLCGIAEDKYQWEKQEVVPVWISSTEVNIDGNVVMDFYSGEKIQFVGTLTGTIDGIILSSTFSSGVTTITISFLSGSLSDEPLEVFLYKIIPNRLMVRWRDDGIRTWSNTHYVELGPGSDYSFYKSLNRLGGYRMRQYEFTVTDPVPFVMSRVEELIT